MSLELQHFSTLCCLGLPPQPALMAIAAGLRDVIPSSWTRICLHDDDGAITLGYAENGAFPAVFVERFDHIAKAQPGSIAALLVPAWRAAGIGWTLHKQNAEYLNTAYYHEIERAVDACWLLDAIVHDGTRSRVSLILTRPRAAKPFRSEDVVVLDRLRPWIAHAFREQITAARDDQDHWMAGSALHKATMIATAAGEILFRSAESEQILMMLNGTSLDSRKHSAKYVPRTPAVVRDVIDKLVRAATGHVASPPSANVVTPWGLICLEASWLTPFGASARDVVADHDAMRIAVNIELREHAVPHIARVLRQCGVTPGQVRIGVLLATGMTKPAIAQELGIKSSSVIDATRKIYERLEVRNAAELGMKFLTAGPRH
jgi:DNA-binding CsgD family transcriptional regulator